MTFLELIRTRATAAWAVLVAATLVMWWIGPEHGISDVRAAGALILILAFIKVHLVGEHFMNLRGAPTLLRRAMDIYVVVTCAALVTAVLVVG